jgi:hypothetical protein
MRKVYTKDLQVGDIIADFDTDRTVMGLDHHEDYTEIHLRNPGNIVFKYIFYPSQSHQVRELKPKRAFFKEEVYRVVAEPGDSTRYDYYIIWDGGSDEFTFAQGQSTFRFPQRMRRCELRELTEIGSEKNKACAKLNDCNPWTVAECARAALEIMVGEI